MLKLNGKPLALNGPPPLVVAVRSFLDKQSSDDLFTPLELSKKAGFAPDSIREARYYDHEHIRGYSLKVGHNRYWGNPKAIKALSAEVSREG
jgi:hypothetical protein